MCISAFANRKGLKEQEAFNYLHDFNGLEFLIDCYEAEHTLSIDDAVNDLTLVCKNNGVAYVYDLYKIECENDRLIQLEV